MIENLEAKSFVRSSERFSQGISHTFSPLPVLHHSDTNEQVPKQVTNASNNVKKKLSKTGLTTYQDKMETLVW